MSELELPDTRHKKQAWVLGQRQENLEACKTNEDDNVNEAYSKRLKRLVWARM